MTLRCLLNLWRFKELRLRGISTPEVANAFAEEFMADYNRRFAKPPRHDFDVHRPFENDKNLGATYTWQEQRKVSKNRHYSMIKIYICLKIMKKTDIDLQKYNVIFLYLLH